MSLTKTPTSMIDTTGAASGQVLTYDGTKWAAAAATTASGPTLGTAITSSGATTYDFLNIPSSTKRITIMFNGVSTNGSSDYLIRLGTSSGIVASGYGGGPSGTTSARIGATNTVRQTYNSTGFVVYNSASTDAVAGQITLTLLSTNTWICSHSMNETDWCTMGVGSITLANTLDRVRITTFVGDQFDGGTINIMWE